MEKIIKEFHGYSNSQIYLIEKDKTLVIRKIGNIERNFNQLKTLASSNFNVPKIYEKGADFLDIEYLHGIDIEEFLKTHDFKLLLSFLLEFFDKLSMNSYLKDYTETYHKKLSAVDFSALPFSKQQLIDKLPKELPMSLYHGDLTLENILYSNNKFYFIDCVTIEYDSWIFDIAKLRQDLECRWFLRYKNSIGLDSYLKIIQNKILEKYPLARNNYLLILMLLRIYPYTIIKKDLPTKHFIEKNINKLWK